MEYAAYLRAEAYKYRQWIEQVVDPLLAEELDELAAICECVADEVEDHLTAG